MTVVSEFKNLEVIVQCRRCAVITAVDLAEDVRKKQRLFLRESDCLISCTNVEDTS